MLLDEIKSEVDLHIGVVEGKRDQLIDGATKHIIKSRFRKIRVALHVLYGYRNIEGNLEIQLTELIQKVKPDIIHIHGTEKQFIRVVPFLNKANIPYIVSLQGLISVVSKKYIAGYSELFIRTFFTNYGFTKRHILPRTNFKIYKAFKRHARLEDKKLQEVKNFAGRTEWDASISSLLNPRSKYFKVNRILKPVFYESFWDNIHPNKRSLRIHTTTSNSFYKGFEIIYEAAYLLQRSGYNVEWNIAGISANDWSVRAAKKKLKDRYAENCFVFKGKISAQELVESMLASDLYVSASHIENSPNSVAEAQLIGMPCIATGVGGTATYIEHNISGIIVPPGDSYALAAAIKTTYEDDEKRILIAKKAKEIAAIRHNKTQIKRDLLEAYDAIITDSLQELTTKSG
jgi:glycosyltransferase involved in cell wall biosynthesis